MAETLRLEIITPQGTVFSEDATLVTLPTVGGLRRACQKSSMTKKRLWSVPRLHIRSPN